jgi:hypothetical protein
MRTSAKILGLISSVSAFPKMMAFGQEEPMVTKATTSLAVQDDVAGAYLYYCDALYEMGWGYAYDFAGSYSTGADWS